MFPDIPEAWQNSGLAGKWFAIREVRDAVLATLEPHRADKTIGSSLEAAPIIKANDDYQLALKEINLADIAIVSDVKITDGNDLEIEFQKAEGEKCVRCWKVLPEVAQSNDDLCNRCVSVVHQKQAA